VADDSYPQALQLLLFRLLHPPHPPSLPSDIALAHKNHCQIMKVE